MSDSDSPDYEPVSCRFYDELGLRMMRGTSTRLLVERKGTRQSKVARIEDIYTEGEAEYVRLDDGTTVRLDHIIEVKDAGSDGGTNCS